MGALYLPTLETEQLILRPLTINDAPALFAYASDPAVTQFTDWKQHCSLKETASFIQKITTPLWGIEHKEYGLIGECGFVQRSAETADIQCAIAPAYWGNGLATQALNHLIAFSFAEYHYQHLQSWVIADNVRSCALARKLGMKHETTLHEYWYTGTHVHDVYIFNISR
ncbi:MAG TPA: GNAT family N-acetyltransferase [Candidatus Babeliales bacterium]|nr:GNAT family N-acetyltransferase [Candidatus Babeliales bacterium]